MPFLRSTLTCRGSRESLGMGELDDVMDTVMANWKNF